MTSIFHEIVIKCTEWSQIEILSKIAIEEGYTIDNLNRDGFEKGKQCYFGIEEVIPSYANFDSELIHPNEKVIDFNEFLKLNSKHTNHEQ